MATYISSTDNRFYAALESGYGIAADISANDRFSANRLIARQQVEVPRRLDKTGSRTFQGASSRLRRTTQFELHAYLTGRDTPGDPPGFGPLLQSALGGNPRSSGAASLQSANGDTLTYAGTHGMQEGDALTLGGEIRFVVAVPDSTRVVVNAPFTSPVSGGMTAGAAVSYGVASELPSFTLYDYWSPNSATQRLLSGAAVDRLEVRVNGDYHELRFKGPACDLVDSSSFESGASGLVQFPAEPTKSTLQAPPIPGHLGQLWIGAGSYRVSTLTQARILVENSLDTRNREFGSLVPRCLVPGERKVSVDFEVYSTDEAAFQELYQAARQRSPIPFMIQLGETPSELMGVYLKGFVPEIPQFNDDDRRLRWQFSASRAQGTSDDEIYIAFG